MSLVQKTTDKIFATKSTLQSTRNSKERIFGKEGKCHNFQDHFDKRMSDREVEINNLHAAMRALSEYMESIGIRMSR